MENILITICARGGSKGIPGKNIKNINSKPLICYSLDIAIQFKNKYSADIAISTDSLEIKNVVEKYGIKVEYLRPEELATDSAGKIGVIRDVLSFYERLNSKEYDFILDLDITSPLRNIEDLINAFQILIKDKNAFNLFSVSPANRNPYFNMVEQGSDGYYHLSKKNCDIMSRQSAPKVYDLNASFYFYRKSFFEKAFQTPITDKSLIYNVPHICFDLDHEIDFQFMEYLILNEKLNFNWI